MNRGALLGLGSVSAAGSGISALRAALEGELPAATHWTTGEGEPPLPVLLAKATGLERFVPARAVRRVDAFSQRMLLAALLALEDAALPQLDPERLGLVVATGYGPLASTFAFLDDVLDKRDALASPILFAGSVHNAPASTISALAGVRGPTLTVTAFSHAFPEALAAGLDWLDRGRVDQVLVVAGDELHPVGAYALTRQRRPEPGGLQPLELDRCTWLPGESYAAALLGRAAPTRYGEVEGPLRFQGRPPPGEGPIFLCARGDAAEGPAYREATDGLGPVAAFANLWGSSPTGDAHTLLAAALAVAAGRLPEVSACRVSAGLTVLAPGPLEARAIRCVSVDAEGNGTELRVRAGSRGSSRRG